MMSMTYRDAFLLVGLSCSLFAAMPDDPPVVFRSDVSIVRVDVRVVDRDNRIITGLNADDFVLREQGRPQAICNFTNEDLPLDVLLLFDVSGSMRPHIERIATAAHQALVALGANDRVAIMVFDRTVRLHSPFHVGRQEIEHELESMLHEGPFSAGTDITRALVVAASYMELHARPGARRAIITLTDDQTEYQRDEVAVLRALDRADSVLSALVAPDATAVQTPPADDSSVPETGKLRFRKPKTFVLHAMPDGKAGEENGIEVQMVITRSHTQPAGVSEIAVKSGGDSMAAEDAAALGTTLERIRRRYALHFHQPADAPCQQERSIDVQLAESACRRYPGAKLHFRRSYRTSSRTLDPGCNGSAGNP